jgi:hypothetical protein
MRDDRDSFYRDDRRDGMYRRDLRDGNWNRNRDAMRDNFYRDDRRDSLLNDKDARMSDVRRDGSTNLNDRDAARRTERRLETREEVRKQN